MNMTSHATSVSRTVCGKSIRALCHFLILFSIATHSFSQDGRYRDLTIPSGLGTVFPTPEHILTHIRNQQDTRAMRNHAWAIFSGLIQPAVPGDMEGEAVWETWYSKREMDAGCRREKYR